MCTNAARQCGHITKQRGAGGGGGQGQVLKGSGSQECQYIKQHLEKSSLNLSVLNYLGFNDIKL